MARQSVIQKSRIAMTPRIEITNNNARRRVAQRKFRKSVRFRTRSQCR
jgi:hypothetical protein